MRIPREQLILWAVCALYEFVEAATPGPMKPTFALKSAAATLFVLGKGDRAGYDAYWQALRDVHPVKWSDVESRHVRGTRARSAIEQILRALPITDLPEFREKVRVTMHGPPKHPRIPIGDIYEAATQEWAAQTERLGRTEQDSVG